MSTQQLNNCFWTLKCFDWLHFFLFYLPFRFVSCPWRQSVSFFPPLCCSPNFLAPLPPTPPYLFQFVLLFQNHLSIDCLPSTLSAWICPVKIWLLAVMQGVESLTFNHKCLCLSFHTHTRTQIKHYWQVLAHMQTNKQTKNIFKKTTFVHQKLSVTTQSSIKLGFYLISLKKKKKKRTLLNWEAHTTNKHYSTAVLENQKVCFEGLQLLLTWVEIKGCSHKRKKKTLSLSPQPRADENLGEVFEVHKTFLELHRKTGLLYSPTRPR